MVQQRSMPTQEQLRVWRDYVETAEALKSLLGGRLQAESGVSSADYRVLLTLSEAQGRSMRSSVLAEQVGWKRSRLSHHLGRMENRGLIRRQRCPDDSRGAEILLTEDGATAFRQSSVPHLRAVRETFIDAFDAEQLSQMDALTTTLRAHLGRSSRE